jgi:hypothetical protein
MAKVGLRIASDYLEKRVVANLEEGWLPEALLDAPAAAELGVIVSKFFRSKQDELVFLALKIVHFCAQAGIDLGLPKDAFCRDVIAVLTRTTGMNSDLIQIVFSLLSTTLFERVFNFTFVDFQIVFHVLGEYLYIADEVTAPLAFLKRLISEKVVKSEVYDLVGRLFDIFYETQTEFFEEESRQCILSFLQHFPIDDLLLVKYTIELTKHVDLEGEYKKGSVVEFLGTIFERHGVEFCREFVG